MDTIGNEYIGHEEYMKRMAEQLDGRAKPDMINHPPHYNQGDIEAIDAIKSALGPEGFKAYCRGNALKYLWRSEYKGNSEADLNKANWYLNRIIQKGLPEIDDF